MTLLSTELVDTLGDLAVEIRESLEAEEHTVIDALDKNHNFRRTNRPKSELVRGILGGAFQRGAQRLGLTYRDGKGGAVELYESVENGFGIIRLKSARRVGNEIRVSANTATTLNGVSDDTFVPEYHFVLGWIAEDNQPLELFVAEIIGIEIGNPGYYILGWKHDFKLPAPPSTVGFQPNSDDDLGAWDLRLDGLEEQA